MAKKTAKKKAAKKKSAAKRQTRKQAQEVLTRGPIRSRASSRPAEQTFPELGDIKDPEILRHAKAFADHMFESEESLASAAAEKQAIRSRMQKIGATMATAHGYEFSMTPGEPTFKARKIRRGSKPADTSEDVPETEDVFADDAHASEALEEASFE